MPTQHKINLIDDIPMFDQIQRVDTLVRCNVCGSVVDGDVVGTTQHILWHSKMGFMGPIERIPVV